MDIGPPRRIIEIQPDSLPLPDLVPEPAPAPPNDPAPNEPLPSEPSAPEPARPDR